MTRIAINGMGRMGLLFFRAVWGRPGIEIVALNEIKGGAATTAHLLQFDSVHGRWDVDIAAGDDWLEVDGKRMSYSAAKDPAATGWDGADIDIVIECTGKFKSKAALQPYLDAGVKKVLVSAPVKEDGVLNMVYGVNHDLYDPALHQIVTAASCTTNCLAPVVKVVHEKLGIKHGSMTTIHDVTNTQTMVDAPHKDLRRARSALNSLIPTTTGSATAITVIYPELKGRLNGHAVRVPLLNASLTDCVFELERETTIEEVNALFKEAAETYLQGIMGYEERPLVSADFVNDDRSSILDAPSTMVVNGTQLKLYAWYDNEWGYVCRMADIAQMLAA